MSSTTENIIGRVPVPEKPHECSWKPLLTPRHTCTVNEGDVWRCPTCNRLWVAHEGGYEQVGRFSFDCLRWLPATRKELKIIGQGPPVKTDKTLWNVALVQEAMDRWRLQNDPAADGGPTMAEFVVAVLEQERRLR